jgi:TIR domain
VPEDATGPHPFVFLSYRRDDTKWTTRAIYGPLCARYGRDHVFHDVDSIGSGEVFRAVIEQRIRESDVLILVIGLAWEAATDPAGNRRLTLPDDPVRLEIAAALAAQVPIIPVLVDGARMPVARELDPSIAALAGYHSAEITDSRWEADISRLVDLIDTRTRSAARGPAPGMTDEQFALYHPAILEIETVDGRPNGAAWYLGHAYAVTTEDVVAAALAGGVAAEADDRESVRARFPLVGPDNGFIAQVVDVFDPPGSTGCRVAVLRLSPAPDVSPARVRTDRRPAGHPFALVDVTSDRPEWEFGRIAAETDASSFVQIETRNARGGPLRPRSCSGSPVLDIADATVVGIVAEVGRYPDRSKLGFMIPTSMIVDGSVIARACIELPGLLEREAAEAALSVTAEAALEECARIVAALGTVRSSVRSLVPRDIRRLSAFGASIRRSERTVERLKEFTEALTGSHQRSGWLADALIVSADQHGEMWSKVEGPGTLLVAGAAQLATSEQLLSQAEKIEHLVIELRAAVEHEIVEPLRRTRAAIRSAQQALGEAE